MSISSLGTDVWTETFVLGEATISLETGRLAKQADAAVVLREKRSMLLATVVTETLHHVSKESYLTVEYRERAAAAGRIPGNYFRRELRPGDHEILLNRLIDRSLRPCLPLYYDRSVSLQILVLSADPESDIASLALLAASAVMALAPLPMARVVVGARMVEKQGAWGVLGNSDLSEQQSDVFLTMAQDGLVAIEGGSDALTLSGLGAMLRSAQQYFQPAFESLMRLCAKVPPIEHSWQTPVIPDTLNQAIKPWVQQAWAHVSSPRRRTWQDAVYEARRKATDILCGKAAEPNSLAVQEDGADDDVEMEPVDNLSLHEAKTTGSLSNTTVWEPHQVRMAFDTLLEQRIRQQTLSGTRIDGRHMQDIRAIDAEVGTMPMCHGSALFTRGQTQALVSVTTGRPGESQSVETLSGQQSQHFFVHYNFPGYATGHVSRFRATTFREYGHGYLARRAFLPLLPQGKGWGKSIRVVSDITESSGSSSMATVCGATLALLDAGVPLAEHVGGISVGLMRGKDSHVILSDLSGDEDMCGDMDLKLAGTKQGLTSFQLDTKQEPVSIPIFLQACEQGWKNLQDILSILHQVIPGPRAEKNLEPEQESTKKSGSSQRHKGQKNASPPQHDIADHTGDTGKQESQETSSHEREESVVDDHVALAEPSKCKLMYQVEQNMVGRVIGSRGRNIRLIEQVLPVKIRADESGEVTLTGHNMEALYKARHQIKALLTPLSKQHLYLVVVAHVEPQGVVIHLGDHIGWLDTTVNELSSQSMQVGDEVCVRVEGCDTKGKLLFSYPSDALSSMAENYVVEQTGHEEVSVSQQQERKES